MLIYIIDQQKICIFQSNMPQRRNKKRNSQTIKAVQSLGHLSTLPKYRNVKERRQYLQKIHPGKKKDTF